MPSRGTTNDVHGTHRTTLVSYRARGRSIEQIEAHLFLFFLLLFFGGCFGSCSRCTAGTASRCGHGTTRRNGRKLSSAFGEDFREVLPFELRQELRHAVGICFHTNCIARNPSRSSRVSFRTYRHHSSSRFVRDPARACRFFPSSQAPPSLTCSQDGLDVLGGGRSVSAENGLFHDSTMRRRSTTRTRVRIGGDGTHAWIARGRRRRCQPSGFRPTSFVSSSHACLFFSSAPSSYPLPCVCCFSFVRPVPHQ